MGSDIERRQNSWTEHDRPLLSPERNRDRRSRPGDPVNASNARQRSGRLVWHFDAVYDVVTLSYVDIVLEKLEDVAWFEQECEQFWRKFNDGLSGQARKDLLVDMSGIVVKPAVATAWNATRARMAEKYIAKTYRFGGDRQTVTAVHLGQVLSNTDGTIYADRPAALAGLLADRSAVKGR